MTPPRVAVVGAGAVGAACARALADGGADVVVRDAGAARAGASWAAAGLLTPARPQELPDAVHALAARSLELWAGIGRRHPEVELRRTGLVLLAGDPAWTEWRRARGLPAERIAWRDGDGLAAPALLLPEVAVVRPPRVAPALLAGIRVERRPVTDLDALRRSHDAVVVAAGAWAGPLLAAAGAAVRVAPRRGQMLLFRSGRLPAAIIDPRADRLAVPRADGRIVVGTTMEDAGFDATTREEDLAALERWARREVPGLGAREDAWAGLRPWTDRPLPAIGRAGAGVLVAAGHGRNGMLLAPATGELVADLVLGRPPRVDPAPFAPAAAAPPGRVTEPG